MKSKLRSFLWRMLGIEYKKALKVHDYIFLKEDSYTSIGDFTYDNGAKVFRWTKAEVKIGKFCSIANDVKFIVDEAFHSASEITSYPLINNLFKNDDEPYSKRTKEKVLASIKQKEGITIGNDVWIGMGALIMPGVSIGNGVTIAAQCVVTKDIPDYSVVAGVPGTIVKKKFDKTQIDLLLEIRWWDWELKKIKERVLDFYQDDKECFIEKYSQQK